MVYRLRQHSISSVLGKLLFKSNCLQLLVTDVKNNYLLYFLHNLKSNMLQLQLLFKSKGITFVLHRTTI